MKLTTSLAFACCLLPIPLESSAFNTLVTSWSEITRVAVSLKNDENKEQLNLF